MRGICLAALAGVLGALAPSIATAQQTGQIRGRITSGADGEGLAGVVILASGPAVQMEQFGLTESDGSFVIPLLPPGVYRLELSTDGYHPRVVDGVEVPLGQTRFVAAELIPTALEAERIVVTAPRTPAIDQGSWELGMNLERSFIQNTPSGRLYTEVLRETPGATQDLVGVSVFGATGAENSYVIEGLNTTGVGFGLAETELPVDFFDEIEIKTAGYMPEHGRSLGGIYNLVLRRGGNEFHGDVFLNVSPGFLQLQADEVGRRGEAIGREDQLLIDLDLGLAVGGPIIRDRLWFFVGFNPRFRLSDVDRTYRTRVDRDGDGEPDVGPDGRDVLEEVGRDQSSRDITYYYLAGKVTLALAEGHRLELSYFGNPRRTHGVQRAIDDSRFSNGLSGDAEYRLGDRRSWSHNISLNYTGQLLDNALIVEAFAGVHLERDKLGRQGGGPSIEYLYERALDEVEPGRCAENPSTPFIDCLVTDYIEGETAFYDEHFARWSAGLSLTHIVSDHSVTYGVETEIKTYDSIRGYAGGYEEIRYGPDPVADPYAFEQFYLAQNGPGDEPILFGTRGQPAFHADVSNLTVAAFLQDTWEITRNITIGGGLRWELEQIQDAQGDALITIADEFAPRLGISYDPTGDGRSRIFASYGWFYESIPLDLNQRSFSAEGFAIRYVDERGQYYCFDEDGNPVDGAPPDCTYDPYGLLGGENSPVVRDLGGQYHEEATLGAEYDVGDGFVIGLSGVFRRLLQAVEDISPDDGNNYFLANPGVNDCDVPDEFREPLAEVCSVDRNGDGMFSPDEYDPERTVFPEPQRRYIGVVLSARKNMSDHWQLLASYTLSRNFGNYTGLFSADNEQLDPNITSQYDLPSLLENRRGPLPNDHTHQVKISGAYQLGGLTDALSGFTIGLRYQGQSGSPISYLGRHELYGRREAFILPRGEGGRTPFLHQVDTMVGYDIPIERDVTLNFNVTVFNVLNSQEAVVVDQEYTTDVVEPHPRGTRLSELQNVDGEDVNVNPTFGEPRRLQPPLYVRLGARLTF